jgi:uncharacterized protein YkwD
MSSTPVFASAVELATPARRNRIVAFVATAVATVALLAAPQMTVAASAAPAPHTATTASKWAHNMLLVLNYERRANHLKPLTMNTKLTLSAHRHNLTMAKKNVMSHQLPGEAFFATRISKAGYNWRSAGENIGWNSAETNRGLQSLEHQMYGEKAPNNGHRLNILNKSFSQVGIDVYFDKAHHKMWFTQDFGQPAA